MRIVFVEIRNFRGIRELEWAPAKAVNCLIGPGDSTKTTILDAIELALNPKSYSIADDSDFFNLVVEDPITITVALADLPAEFKSDERYGTYLRGWNEKTSKVEDELGEGLEDALSVRVTIDKSLEARWSIFNNRIDEKDGDPPLIRYKDVKQLATTRLGPYAERHLGWGRQSVLTRIGEKADNINLQLAEAGRAARKAFRQSNKSAFDDVVKQAETLGKQFSVPVRKKYSAELDVETASFTTGGIALHDGDLPLRRLGTGSSRLIVSALQHGVGSSCIALIDEIEYGLEPHRIARLLKYLKSSTNEDDKAARPQVFMTTHSPVVILELAASEILAVRSESGHTEVRSVAATAKDLVTAQKHLRSSPEAFLARRILVGEGRTEQGLLRGLDAWWSKNEKDSFALQGAIAIDGGGNSKAPVIAEHLLDLGYEVLLFLDTDELAPSHLVDPVKKKGGIVFEWPDRCATEHRIFLDVSWDVLQKLVKFAEECMKSSSSVRDSINNVCKEENLPLITDLSLPVSLDTPAFRRCIGEAARKKDWFKDIERGERIAEIIAPCLDQISDKSLAKTIADIRGWVDA
jgi:putative ATP-dependent endonuclease of OLD family